MPNRYTAAAEAALVSNSSGQSTIQTIVSSLGGANVQDAQFAIALLSENSIIDGISSHFDFSGRYRLRRRASLRRFVRRRLRARYAASTGLIKIDYTDTDPRFATEVVGYAVKALARRFDALAAGQAATKADRLSVELNLARRALYRAQAAEVSFEREHNIIAPAAQINAELNELNELESELIGYRFQASTLERSGRSPSDGELVLAQREARSAHSVMSSLVTGPVSGVFLPENQIPRHQMEYSDLTNDVSMSRSLYASLRQQYEMTRLQAVGGSALMQLVDPPQVPELPSGPQRAKIIILVTLLVFLTSCLIAVMKDVVLRRSGTAKRAHQEGETRPKTG